MSAAARWLALQRITALWAFCESGLGGVLHALRMPFTGLIVGSFAIICITLIAWISEGHYRKVLHSLLLVLIIKAVVSPHSPPTAYLAVAFQGAAGFLLYSAIGVRAFSIYTLAILALLESALQKLVTMTLFFGASFWKAANALTAFVDKELSVGLPSGSLLLIIIYVSIYLLGGLVCGALATRLLRDFESGDHGLPKYIPAETHANRATQKGRRRKGLMVMILLFLFICALLYLSAGNRNSGRMELLHAFIWTASALLLWYGLVAPLALHLLHRSLRKKRTHYGTQVHELMRLLPSMRRLALAAWAKSGQQRKGPGRLPYFVRLLVHWSLSSETVEIQSPS